MLFYNFNNFYFLLPFIYFFFLIWFFFFKINKTQKLKNFKKDIYFNINILKKQHFKIFININFFVLINLFLLFFFLRGEVNSFWWNHLLIQNFNLYLIFILLLVNLALLFIIDSISFNKINYSNDYFFALLNLTVLLPIIFLSNNIFSFIFILELNTSIIFYKLVVSKLWYQSLDKNKKLNKIKSKNYINLIFYQFWITFFSTIMIFFFYINTNFIFGTTDWALVNFITFVENNINYFNKKILLILLSLIFLFSLFFKVGVAPFHLFKIEIYKSIPYLSILFYTTYYIVAFLFFLLYLLSNLYLSLFFYIWFIFSLTLILGSIYIISLLFDVNFIKAFFAYSTIINTTNFIIIIVSNLI
jgi:NADH:ubiquinone oxidoreductase subunit 2 (subunit N)